MKTLVLGASNNPDRYSYKAISSLLRHEHDVVAVSNKKAEVLGLPIEDTSKIHEDIDTITLYVGPANQSFYEDYIIATKPRRVIFNPGTENDDLENRLNSLGIETTEACTLVLLSTGQY